LHRWHPSVRRHIRDRLAVLRRTWLKPTERRALISQSDRQGSKKLRHALAQWSLIVRRINSMPGAEAKGAYSSQTQIDRRKGKDLIYAGKVDHGIDAEGPRHFARFTALTRKAGPIASASPTMAFGSSLSSPRSSTGRNRRNRPFQGTAAEKSANAGTIPSRSILGEVSQLVERWTAAVGVNPALRPRVCPCEQARVPGDIFHTKIKGDSFA
jgi:hypothetical protein